MGHPDFVLAPLVVGPKAVPLIRDEAEAERDPELAVLSALAHANAPEAAEVGKAALTAAHSLDDDRSALYVDLVLAHIGGAARVFLEDLMASRNYEYQSDFAKRYFGQGKAEGRAEGRAEGQAEGLAEGRAVALLKILTGRGLEVPDDARQQILSCKDLSLLDTWLTRAITANSVSEVLA